MLRLLLLSRWILAGWSPILKLSLPYPSRDLNCLFAHSPRVSGYISAGLGFSPTVDGLSLVSQFALRRRFRYVDQEGGHWLWERRY